MSPSTLRDAPAGATLELERPIKASSGPAAVGPPSREPADAERWRPLALIARGVFIEAIRRRELYVLLIIMSLFVGGAVVVAIIGVESSAVSRFVINLGLTLAAWCSHVLGALLAARQIPAELEQRTIYPVLAKPISRGQYLVGKWIASTASAIFAFALFSALSLAATAALPQDQPLSTGLLVEAVALQWFSLGMICAIAMLATLLVPHGVGVTGVLALYFTGEKLIGFFEGRAAGGSWGGALNWLAGYLPNFGRLNYINVYTEGICNPGPIVAGAALYAVIITAVALLAANLVFQRRPL